MRTITGIAAALAAAVAAFQLAPDAGTGPVAAGPADAAAPGDAGPPGAAPQGGATGSDAAGRRSTADAGLRVVVPADGGPVYLGDSPDRMRVAGDGGATDGGADAGPRAEELQDLRNRVAALERELAMARADAGQTQELQKLNQQIADLRDQLAQEQRQARAREQASEDARIAAQQAVSTLSAADRQLASGDAQVLDALDAAGPALPAAAQREVASARAAISSGDLAAARYHLGLAIAQAQRVSY